MTLNKVIIYSLDKLVFLMTEPFCNLCNQKASKLGSGEEYCPHCKSSDNIIRVFEDSYYGHGASFFYQPVLESLRADECRIDRGFQSIEDWFEEVLNTEFGQAIVCNKEVSSGSALRILDLNEFNNKMEDYINEIIQKNEVILIAHKLYISHQLEMIIFNKMEEFEKTKVRNINFEEASLLYY